MIPRSLALRQRLHESTSSHADITQQEQQIRLHSNRQHRHIMITAWKARREIIEVTERFALSSVCPWTYVTFPAYSVINNPSTKVAKRLGGKTSRGKMTNGWNAHKSSLRWENKRTVYDSYAHLHTYVSARRQLKAGNDSSPKLPVIIYVELQVSASVWQRTSRRTSRWRECSPQTSSSKCHCWRGHCRGHWMMSSVHRPTV